MATRAERLTVEGRPVLVMGDLNTLSPDDARRHAGLLEWIASKGGGRKRKGGSANQAERRASQAATEKHFARLEKKYTVASHNTAQGTAPGAATGTAPGAARELAYGPFEALRRGGLLVDLCARPCELLRPKSGEAGKASKAAAAAAAAAAASVAWVAFDECLAEACPFTEPTALEPDSRELPEVPKRSWKRWQSTVVVFWGASCLRTRAGMVKVIV